jgi:hypothetical protein
MASAYTFHWGGERFPLSEAHRHIAVIGATGSGKTVTIRGLMQQAVTSLLPSFNPGAFDGRAVVYDAKQDMLSYLVPMVVPQLNIALKQATISGWSKPDLDAFRRSSWFGSLSGRRPSRLDWLPDSITVMNPFDVRSAAWDMAADITSPATVQQIATMLIPDEKNSTQPFFTQAARHLLHGVLMVFVHQAQSTGARWTLRDVLLALRLGEGLRDLYATCQHTKHLGSMYINPGQTFDNLKSTIASKMMPYEAVAGAWSHAKRSVSLRAFCTARNRGILVLGNDEQNREAVDSINRVLFKRITELVISQSEEEERYVWFFLDEVREMGNLGGLSSLLLRGRSKGACVVMGLQDIDGLREVYGDRRAQELMGQCGFKGFLRLESPTTAEWGAKHFGLSERLVQRGGKSVDTGGRGGVSISTRDELEKREVVLYSRLMQLEPPREGVLSGYYTSPGGLLPTPDDSRPTEVPFTEPNRLGQRPPNPLLERLRGIEFMPRPEDHQYLRPWDDGDMTRLGLPASLLSAQTMRSPTI